MAGNLFRMLAVRKLLQDLLLTLDGHKILEEATEYDESSCIFHQREISGDLPWDLLLYMTAGQGYVGDWEIAIPTGLVTKSDAGVLTYADQAHTALITQRTLVVIKVRVALGGP